MQMKSLFFLWSFPPFSMVGQWLAEQSQEPGVPNQLPAITKQLSATVHKKAA